MRCVFCAVLLVAAMFYRIVAAMEQVFAWLGDFGSEWVRCIDALSAARVRDGTWYIIGTIDHICFFSSYCADGNVYSHNVVSAAN